MLNAEFLINSKYSNIKLSLFDIWILKLICHWKFVICHYFKPSNSLKQFNNSPFISFLSAA